MSNFRVVIAATVPQEYILYIESASSDKAIIEALSAFQRGERNPDVTRNYPPQISEVSVQPA